MRARVFLGEDGAHRLAAEISVEDADHAWRHLEASPEVAGRRLLPGDILYIGDVYLQLNGDGGWRRLGPNELTANLYRQIVDTADPG